MVVAPAVVVALSFAVAVALAVAVAVAVAVVVAVVVAPAVVVALSFAVAVAVELRLRWCLQLRLSALRLSSLFGGRAAAGFRPVRGGLRGRVGAGAGPACSCAPSCR